MALTPHVNDPNRKSELQRKKTDPDSFGPYNTRKSNEEKDSKDSKKAGK